MKRVVAAALLFILALACAKKAEAPKVAAAAPALPPGHPPVSAAPAPQPAAQAPAGATLTGKVVETMDAGGYTYIKLRTASGDVWAAVQQTKVAVGETTTIAPQMTLDNFESKTLNRKFDHIIFGVAARPAGAGAAQHMAAPADSSAPVGVAKAEGTSGKTIAEIWAERDKLKDAPVTVRGTVVKFLPAIMGKNWLHLRDGSGDHDITVTTDDVVAVGNVVLVHGTVRIDQDFGAGYRYPVIVEEAKVSR